MHQINECTKNYFQTFSELPEFVRGISALSEGNSKQHFNGVCK